MPEAQEADVDAAVAAAGTAFSDRADTAPADRAAELVSFAEAVEKRAAEFSQLISSPNGVLVAVSAQPEPVYPATLLRYDAGLIENETPDVRDGKFGGTLTSIHL